MARHDADAVQAEIERTRADLARTVDSLADRLSPKRAARRGARRVARGVGDLVDDVGGMFSGSGVVRRDAHTVEPPEGSVTTDEVTSSTYELRKPPPTPLVIGVGVGVVAVGAYLLWRRSRRR
ncbi:MAG: DUF3618 domain-containing protein [Streptosporangiales bacterium]|nr:DUF3618 domain-containing protein [Streptosporangiales bacterium]